MPGSRGAHGVHHETDSVNCCGSLAQQGTRCMHALLLPPVYNAHQNTCQCSVASSLVRVLDLRCSCLPPPTHTHVHAHTARTLRAHIMVGLGVAVSLLGK